MAARRPGYKPRHLLGQAATMRFSYSTGGFQQFWMTPILAGVGLILLGIILFKNPRLLAYFVAALFVVAGASLIAVGWRLRRRVTYRRLDEDGPANEQDPR